MSLKAKLSRMKTHLSHESARTAGNPAASAHSLGAPADQAEVGATVDSAAPLAIPYLEQWRELQAVPYGTEEAYVLIREVRYPLEYQHGPCRFSELADVVAAWTEAGAGHPLSSAGRKAEELLFFDTETTGLHGGTGNTIFLLGYCRIVGGEVRVRQHFLPAPHAEAVLYQSFLGDVTDLSQLVTFNGKAFDWPQVKTRHTLLRHQVPALPAFGHYDLLHASRRLWKHELPSCRLSLIEQAKLGIRREHDVPGHMAPMLYFDFLQSQDPASVFGVLQHNEWDVLSLISLYIHISRLLLGHDEQLASMEERFEIARWYDALGMTEAAAQRFAAIAASTHALRIPAKTALGHLYKKQKRWQEALQQWQDVIGESRHVPEEVYVEAAKLCEHQLKDAEQALYYARLAFEQWKRKGQMLRQAARKEREAHRKRLERLESKVDHQDQMAADWF